PSLYNDPTHLQTTTRTLHDALPISANDLERSTTLWDRVITRQVAVDQMTPAEADALEFPETIEPRSENSLGGDEGYLLMAVRKELLDQGFTEEEINTGGFTIDSTIDPGIQENTVQAVENLPDDRRDRSGRSPGLSADGVAQGAARPLLHRGGDQHRRVHDRLHDRSRDPREHRPGRREPARRPAGRQPSRHHYAVPLHRGDPGHVRG